MYHHSRPHDQISSHALELLPVLSFRLGHAPRTLFCGEQEIRTVKCKKIDSCAYGSVLGGFWIQEGLLIIMFVGQLLASGSAQCSRSFQPQFFNDDFLVSRVSLVLNTMWGPSDKAVKKLYFLQALTFRSQRLRLDLKLLAHHLC